MKQRGIWIVVALAGAALLALIVCPGRQEPGPKREAVKGLQALDDALRSPAPEALLKAIVVPQALASRTVPEQSEFLRKAKPGIRITLLGAVHMSFTDMAVIKAFGIPGYGKVYIDASRAAIGEFFGQHLLGKHSELLEKGSAKYPLAKIETPR